MEITYIIAGYIVLVVAVYFHSRVTFTFARRGEGYLQSLIDTPEKYDNDLQVLNTLRSRDLPCLIDFISIEPKLHKVMLVALIVNVVGIFYPTDALVGSYLGWFLLLLLTIVNADVMMTFLALRRNKQIVSQLCNGYYNLTLAHENANEKFHNMADAIERAFAEIKEKRDEVDQNADDER